MEDNRILGHLPFEGGQGFQRYSGSSNVIFEPRDTVFQLSKALLVPGIALVKVGKAGLEIIDLMMLLTDLTMLLINLSLLQIAFLSQGGVLLLQIGVLVSQLFESFTLVLIGLVKLVDLTEQPPLRSACLLSPDIVAADRLANPLLGPLVRARVFLQMSLELLQVLALESPVDFGGSFFLLLDVRLAVGLGGLVAKACA